ncbi:hypothetical protein DFJ73DRAFT_655553, partial [Zopfochytrium polystomum]
MPRSTEYQTEIAQMMFVFGEVPEPLDETTELVEEITRAQIIELVRAAQHHNRPFFFFFFFFIVHAVAQAQKRGSKNLSAEDLIFLIRHDRKKTSRLRTFLSWKDVRKNVKNKDGAEADEEMAEDGGPASDTKSKARAKKIKFSWDLINSYSSILSDDEDEEVEDEEDKQAYLDQLLRLRTADEVTRSMTKDEYMYYSECRQATFTYKKNKKFRDWCNMNVLYKNQKPNGDVIDILGFLSCECVGRLTETALQVKREWDAHEREERQRTQDSR